MKFLKLRSEEGVMAVAAQPQEFSVYPPLFGVRRELRCSPLRRFNFTAGDGSELQLHHTSGGEKGPVIIAPGTAMTALTYCIDTVGTNLVEFLVGEGFDVWLFDWRTSPLLQAHRHPYSLEDVARYDWPSALDEVRRLTGKQRVCVLAHCLSSTCFLLSLLRGYLQPDRIRFFVASQVGLHFQMPVPTTLKIALGADRLAPAGDMIHQKAEESTRELSDRVVSLFSRMLPKSCDNLVCRRHRLTFGELIHHPRVNPATHHLMGDLIPECQVFFLKDVALWSRKGTVLSRADREHFDRISVPIRFISGNENRMFTPGSTAQTYRMLCEKNGEDLYRRTVYEGFGHLDCFVGDGARDALWPDVASDFENA